MQQVSYITLMLVTCATLVSYLIEKAMKAGIAL